MRVMQICTNFLPGGIQRHVLDLTVDLRAGGHKVVLAGGDGDWSGEGNDPDFLPVPITRVAGTGGSAVNRVAALLPCARLLRRAIRDRGIELVHAHETAPAMVARLATLGLGVPVVLTFHGSAPEREASAARIARHCADITISPSQASLEALIAKGLPRERGRVIGLGISPLPAIDPADARALRGDLLAGRAGPLILSLSRLQPQKGIDVMVQVAARVVERHPGAVFAIAGKGPLLEQAQGWARAAGVADNIRFVGAISTVPLHLAASDMFLLTSRWENLPISIVEAFRAGLPVVATDCGGVRELVDDSVGALLPVGDADGIAAALLALIEQPDLRRAKGEAALALSAQDRFAPAAVHARFAAMYEDLITNRKTHVGA